MTQLSRNAQINVFPIHLPPLRDRRTDIPLLVQTFIRRLQANTKKPVTGLTREAMDIFINYAWPGNVRELKGALEYAFIITEEGLIGLNHLPPKIIAGRETRPASAVLSKPVDSIEKTALMEALRQSNGNQSQAARLLGINRVTVWNRMKKYSIDLKRVMVS